MAHRKIKTSLVKLIGKKFCLPSFTPGISITLIGRGVGKGVGEVEGHKIDLTGHGEILYLIHLLC